MDHRLKRIEALFYRTEGLKTPQQIRREEMKEVVGSCIVDMLLTEEDDEFINKMIADLYEAVFECGEEDEK